MKLKQAEINAIKAQGSWSEWMQEQLVKKQAEVNELNNKVSELTEALDASHIFCEGVKEHYIDKACREFCHNCTHEENCEAHCYRYKHFFESMKGE